MYKVQDTLQQRYSPSYMRVLSFHSYVENTCMNTSIH